LAWRKSFVAFFLVLKEARPLPPWAAGKKRGMWASFIFCVGDDWGAKQNESKMNSPQRKKLYMRLFTHYIWNFQSEKFKDSNGGQQRGSKV